MTDSPEVDPIEALSPVRQAKQRELSQITSFESHSWRGWVLAGAIFSVIGTLLQWRPERMGRFLAGEGIGVVLTVPCAWIAFLIASSLMGISLGSWKAGTLKLVAIWMITHSLGFSVMLLSARIGPGQMDATMIDIYRFGQSPGVFIYFGLLIGHVLLSIALVQQAFDWELSETILFVGLMDFLLLGGVVGIQSLYPAGWTWLTS